jgi:hypothetical protein
VKENGKDICMLGGRFNNNSGRKNKKIPVKSNSVDLDTLEREMDTRVKRKKLKDSGEVDKTKKVRNKREKFQSKSSDGELVDDIVVTQHSDKNIEKKRERSPSQEALSISQEQKKSKPNTAVEVLDKSEVDDTESVVPLKIDDRTESEKFGDLYQIKGDNTQYKFIRKSGSKSHIIYLERQGDDSLYEYDTRAEKIEKHQMSQFHKMTTNLSPGYVEFAKNLLLGNQNSLKLKTLNKRSLGAISVSLMSCADKLVKELRKEDNEEIDLSANSKYGIILQRSVRAIRDKYGLLIDYVAAVQKDNLARDGLSNVVLRHSTQRWKDNKNKNIGEVAESAAIYLMSTSPEMEKTMKRVANNHSGYSESAIIEAYASAICGDKDNIDLINLLAEARLRYSPITYGSDIYFAANTDDPSETEEWSHFNTLIHEALHSVQHPNFISFLDDHIPPGLHEKIKEGIVDYLTSKIWKDVLDKFPPAKVPKNSPSDPDFNKPLQISIQAKNIYHENYFAYDKPVETVKKLISSLKGGGEERLISAYFGGNLGAFLPKLINTEEKQI